MLPAMRVPPRSILYDLCWMFDHTSGPTRPLLEEGRLRDPCDPPTPTLAAVTFGESPVFQGAKDFFRFLPAPADTKAQYYCGI